MNEIEQRDDEIEIKAPHPLLIKIIILILSILSILYCYMRFWSHNQIKIKEYPLIEETLSSNWNGFKIIHFSDIHFGVTTDIIKLEHAVDKINLTKADIVIFTGDLLDKNVFLTDKDKDDLKKILSKIDAKIKKIAIYGDNDYFDKDLYLDIMNTAGFHILENENIFIYQNGMNPIQIAGISPMQSQDYDIKKSFNTEESNIEYRLLLSHEPVILDEISDENINLILSGHSLGGLIRLPGTNGILKKEYTNTYQTGFYQKDQKKLFVSNGIGTEKYPYRFLNVPSINLYRLYNY